jgi:uncharacterized protein (DUF1697 family)
MMNTYIALLRGINVGGRNKLRMRDLVQLLEELGLKNVKTYIQSGNVVFQSEPADLAKLSTEISEAIGESHGFTPQIFILNMKAMQKAMSANPFPEGEDEPKSLHLFFLDAIPKDLDLTALEAVQKDSERFELIDDVFYLHAPDGIGRSKLAERVGRGWNVSITARNWRTVNKIMEMATSCSG